jgi:hypothetical protein
MEILVVGGHENVVDSRESRALEQIRHQSPADPLPLSVPSHGDVVDEDLRIRAACHGQGVRGQSSDDLVADKRRERPEIDALEEPRQVRIVQLLVRLLEHVRHHCKQHRRDVAIVSGQSPRSDFLHGHSLRLHAPLSAAMSFA